MAAALFLAFAAACSAGPALPPEPEPSGSAPAAAVDYGKLEAAISDAIDNGGLRMQTINAVLVSVDGRTVVSHYRNAHRPDEQLHVWSVTKSVTSALVGIAIADGLIAGVDQTLADLLPGHKAQMTAEIASVTLRQLMNNTAGFADERQSPQLIWDVFDQDSDAVAFILKRGLANPPGQIFGYSSSSAHLVTAVLAAALERADGPRRHAVLRYAEEKLFAPLDIDTKDAFSGRVAHDDSAAFDRAGFGWGTDAQGLNTGCCLLRLTPADMIKFGELYLDDGKWQGRQILPPGWVEQSMTPSSATTYGLMWWLDRSVAGGPAYTARGADGQLILVAPEDRLVVAVGSVPTTEDVTLTDEDVLAMVQAVILPAFQ